MAAMSGSIRNLRASVAVIVMVLFNVSMTVLAFRSAQPMRDGLFVTWFLGDFAVTLLALFATDPGSD
jgi:hypothetical protein